MEEIEIRYSIKYLVLHVFGNLILVALGIYLLALTDFEELKKFKIKDTILPLISIVFILYYGKKAISEFLNYDRKIVFSKNGIHLNKRFFDWNDIKKKKVISKEETTGKYHFTYLEFYLKFQHKGNTIEIKIDGYTTSADEVKQLLKRFSK